MSGLFKNKRPAVHTLNYIVCGDNLHTLCRPDMEGKVKLIYIDPPYNTGKKFTYDDSSPTEEWLAMMMLRLELAERCLTPDGVILVSIDEKMHHRLRLAMDTLFGFNNFIAEFVITGNRHNQARLVSVSHEYMLCYAKDAERLKADGVTWREERPGIDAIENEMSRLIQLYGSQVDKIADGMKTWFDWLPALHPAKPSKVFNKVDARGLYRLTDISAPGGGGGDFDIMHPVTKKPCKPPGRGWRMRDKRAADRLIAKRMIHFGPDESVVPQIKLYLADARFQVPQTVIKNDGRAAMQRLRDLMGDYVFDYPKCEVMLQQFIQMMTGGTDLVLDFFAGSGTTAHAVFLANARDGGNRRFVLVQEPTGPGPYGNMGIYDLTCERVKLAGRQVAAGRVHPNWHQDIHFQAICIEHQDTFRHAAILKWPEEIIE